MEGELQFHGALGVFGKARLGVQLAVAGAGQCEHWCAGGTFVCLS